MDGPLSQEGVGMIAEYIRGKRETYQPCKCKVIRGKKCSKKIHKDPKECQVRDKGGKCKECDDDEVCECSNREQGFECDAKCGSMRGVECLNRGLSLGKTKKLIIVSKPFGFGLASTEPILAGELICEFLGVLYMHYDNPIHATTDYAMLLLDMDSEDLTKNVVLEPTFEGNEGRLVNHSEDANCEPDSLIVGDTMRIGFYALKNINVGQEILFNYGVFYKELGIDRCNCQSLEYCVDAVNDLEDTTKAPVDLPIYPDGHYPSCANKCPAKVVSSIPPVITPSSAANSSMMGAPPTTTTMTTVPAPISSSMPLSTTVASSMPSTTSSKIRAPHTITAKASVPAPVSAVMGPSVPMPSSVAPPSTAVSSSMPQSVAPPLTFATGSNMGATTHTTPTIPSVPAPISSLIPTTALVAQPASVTPMDVNTPMDTSTMVTLPSLPGPSSMMGAPNPNGGVHFFISQSVATQNRTIRIQFGPSSQTAPPSNCLPSTSTSSFASSNLFNQQQNIITAPGSTRPSRTLLRRAEGQQQQQQGASLIDNRKLFVRGNQSDNNGRAGNAKVLQKKKVPSPIKSKPKENKINPKEKQAENVNKKAKKVTSSAASGWEPPRSAVDILSIGTQHPQVPSTSAGVQTSNANMNAGSSNAPYPSLPGTSQSCQIDLPSFFRPPCSSMTSEERQQMIKDIVNYVISHGLGWTCLVCHKTLTKKQYYEKHLAVHYQPEGFKCTFAGCSRSFNLREQMERHAETHKPDDERTWFYCSDCNARFGTSGDVCRHINSDSNNCKKQQYKKVFPGGAFIYAGRFPPVEDVNEGAGENMDESL